MSVGDMWEVWILSKSIGKETLEFAGKLMAYKKEHSTTRVGCRGNEGKDNVNWRPHSGVMNFESDKTFHGSEMRDKEDDIGCTEGIKWGSW